MVVAEVVQSGGVFRWLMLLEDYRRSRGSRTPKRRCGGAAAASGEPPRAPSLLTTTGMTVTVTCVGLKFLIWA